jgi:hypothetical protein
MDAAINGRMTGSKKSWVKPSGLGDYFLELCLITISATTDHGQALKKTLSVGG